jgi:hypothetical protein
MKARPMLRNETESGSGLCSEANLDPIHVENFSSESLNLLRHSLCLAPDVEVGVDEHHYSPDDKLKIILF